MTEWNSGTAEHAGIVVRGHRVASGEAGDPRFPRGTIAAQLPVFRARGVDLSDHAGPIHPATLNVRLSGRVRLRRPEITLHDVRWSDQVPAETFHLSRGTVVAHGMRHKAWLYMPDRATKPDHHQPPDIVELLAGWIPAFAYGTAVVLGCDRDVIEVGGPA